MIIHAALPIRSMEEHADGTVLLDGVGSDTLRADWFPIDVVLHVFVHVEIPESESRRPHELTAQLLLEGGTMGPQFSMPFVAPHRDRRSYASLFFSLPTTLPGSGELRIIGGVDNVRFPDIVITVEGAGQP